MSVRRKKGPERTGGTKRRRTPSDRAIKATQRKNSAEWQNLREGTPADLVTSLADQERKGAILREPDLVRLPPEDCIPEEYMDSETPTADDDDPVNPDLDESRLPKDGIATRQPGSNILDEDLEAGESTAYVIEVDSDGSCEALRPTWICGHAGDEDGDKALDEIDRRFKMFDDIATWLNNNRRKFLRSANPIDLGQDAFVEMEKGHASVSPSGFLVLSSIERWMAESMNIKESSVGPFFSRYTTACSLVWENGSGLPLDFLFGTEARNAWVACAVRQFFDSKGITLDPGNLRGITIPRNPGKRSRLAGKSLSSLTQQEFVARANQMAGTKWEEVMETYFSQ